MKNFTLLFTFIFTAFLASSQVICSGVSPASISGDYNFAWADPAGGDWSTPDFLTPGVFVQDTLMMINDGSPGVNAQGNPISAEGCAGSGDVGAPPASTQWNDLTGKIAVIYRNTCEFGYKALQAQNAGAVAAIIINREDAIVEMGGGVEGLNVTIPVVFISSVDGLTLTTEMNNGPVVMFLGNKVGAYTNDVGASADQMLVSPYGASNTFFDNGFDLGIQIYNFGTASQSDITVQAKIDGPSGTTVYDETVSAPLMASGDTLAIFNGNPVQFPPFDLGGIGMYPTGEYTLSYTLNMSAIDESDYDNSFSSKFTVNDDMISLANLNSDTLPLATTFPSNSTVEYQSCMFYQDPNASSVGVLGTYIIPYTDTSINNLAGAEIFINFLEWNDPWTDLTDPNYAGGANNNWFQALDFIAYATHYPTSNSEVGVPVYVPFDQPVEIQDNQRYLICLQSFDPAISFGYDGNIDYDGNQGISAMPVSPVYVDDTWYTGGWVSSSAPAIGLKVIDGALLGVDNSSSIESSAYPNPAKDLLTISTEATGSGSIVATDISGKICLKENINLKNNQCELNISNLENGVYVFNLTLENGNTSQFKVVKK